MYSHAAQSSGVRSCRARSAQHQLTGLEAANPTHPNTPTPPCVGRLLTLSGQHPNTVYDYALGPIGLTQPIKPYPTETTAVHSAVQLYIMIVMN